MHFLHFIAVDILNTWRQVANSRTVKSVGQSVIRIVLRLTKLKKQPAGVQKWLLCPAFSVILSLEVTSTDSSSSCSLCAENGKYKA